MFNPLALFSSVKSAAITVGVIAMITFTGTLWVQNRLKEDKIVSLKIEKASLENQVLQKTTEIEGLTVTLNVLQTTVTDLQAAAETESNINQDIANAPAEDDGPVAPVLRNTLGAVDRLLHPNTQ